MPLLPENVVALGRIGGPLLDRNLKRKNAGTGEENLSFGNTSVINPNVLYLDVINGRIGINTDVPSHDFTISTGVRTLNLIVPTQAEIQNFVITSNTIQDVSTTITISPNQAVDPIIDMVKIGTYDYGSSVAYLNLSDKLIENIKNNSNIEFSANGTGFVNITTSKLYVDGNFTATGSVTWDGSLITLGTDDTDNVVFNAEINSNIIPDDNETWDLGTASKRWDQVYVKNYPVDNLTLNTAVINGVDMLLEQGNTIYVSIYGNDGNVGTHLHNTYRTIKYALSQAIAGDTVVIFPGTYEEVFPLTVPAGVTVNGADIRAVNVIPTTLTQNKDGFLLNGETTVSNLTVKNFYYDAVNDTGYGFRLASNITVTSRSPYVQNCTVITQTPNAGRGALVDGSVANASSKEATILFHSITMIIPGSVGIHATNGARVEWLDSFTYFAEKGIYLTQGTLGFASLGTKYGAEMRSIGSANIYGTYGAVADGADTIAYLINHNFAYVGTGTDSTNDRGLVVQANEVLELNSGRIYHESTDHKGDFRIGDIFYVNQETGAVVFNAQSISFSPTGNIVLNGPTSSAFVDATRVEVGNIRIAGNTISSLTGPVNFLAFSGNTYLNTNVFVTGNTEISADVLVKGNLYLGNQPTDTITIYPELTQDLLPDNVGGPFNLGTNLKRWNTLYSSLINIDNVLRIDNNTIETLTSNTDLRLLASGTGKVKITSTDVQIDNELTVNNNVTVNGLTSLKNAELNNLTLVGALTQQTGNTYITGTLINNNNLSITGSSYFQASGVKIFNNEISATVTNADLQFLANGTGGVNLENLKIRTNEILNVRASPTNDFQKSIYIQPNGTGNVIIDSIKSLKIPVGNNTNRILATNGEIRYNSDLNIFEGFQQTNRISFNDISDIDRNTYVQAGTTDNTIYFGVNGVQKATIDSTKLYTSTYYIDNISLTGNTINNRVSGNNLTFMPNGTGNTLVNSVGFSADNTITNFSNQPLIIKHTGLGYLSFASAAAIMIPTGVSAERRATPEVGETRFNTEKDYMEVYTGDITQGENGWVSAIGVSSGIVDANVIEGFLDIWTLVLG